MVAKTCFLVANLSYKKFFFILRTQKFLTIANGNHTMISPHAIKNTYWFLLNWLFLEMAPIHNHKEIIVSILTSLSFCTICGSKEMYVIIREDSFIKDILELS